MKPNPFRPGSIVAPGCFAGRYEEMTAIDRGLFQTMHQNPWHFLIHGERGIGKSSLLFVAERTAGGELPPMGQPKTTFRFVPVSISLEPSDTYPDLIGKVGRELSTQLGKQDKWKHALRSAWDFFSRWEVMGVSYDAKEKPASQSELLENLAQTFVQANSSLSAHADGFLVLIDEADKACKSAQLGEFLKVFTERLTKHGCNRVCVGLAGISEVIDGLRQSHESSVRILHSMRLDALNHDEQLEAIRRGIEWSNQGATVKTRIRPDAADLIAHLSEGYPHFIQQYAYSAFESDMDDDIDVHDVMRGVYAENGALDQLGIRYFEGMYSDEIDSDDYRSVLKVMAAYTDSEYMSRKQIKTTSGLKDTTLTNALGALSKRHIIKRHREKSGLYKLPSGSFRAWIIAKAKKESQSNLSLFSQAADVPKPPDSLS